MKYDEFWVKVKTLNNWVELETLKHKKNFNAKYNGSLVLIQPESTMVERKIDQGQFIIVWNLAKQLPKQEQFKRSNYNKMTRNGSYILTIMKHFLKKDSIE